MASAAPKPNGPQRSRGISFIAPDIAGAVNDIRDKLGPGAIILDIRRAAPKGLGRLWQKSQVEVIACLPEEQAESTGPASPSQPPGPPLGAPPASVHASPAKAPQPAPAQAPSSPAIPTREALHRYARAGSGGVGGVGGVGTPAGSEFLGEPLLQEAVGAASGDPEPRGDGWRCGAVFERLGLVPLASEQVLARMQDIHGAGRRPPETLAQELVLARTAFRQLWRATSQPAPGAAAPLHVFIGAPGVGKSTALCKWLAQTILLENQPARVWRLDGRTTNASEMVSLYGEILGLRVERTWNGREDFKGVGFVDLAGADFHDREAVDALGESLARLPGAIVHLVLNAAYSVPLLMAQARAFSRLPVDDMILTHLDEETGWGKLWNLVLGTNYPISRLSAGQNVPGRFLEARVEQLTGTLFGS